MIITTSTCNRAIIHDYILNVPNLACNVVLYFYSLKIE